MDQEIRDPEIREALELLEEYRKGGLHGTPAGRWYSRIVGTGLVILGVAMFFGLA